jgi:hypothetical protein
MTLITGNTYPHRSALRAMGGEWDAAAKGWAVPDTVADEARKLVQSAPARRYRSHYARFSSGAEYYRNKQGRCEDAPCCGCCSY